MKRLFFLLLILATTSCSDLLEEAPKAVATDTFYKSASEMESAVYSIYAPLQEIVFYRNYLLINLAQVDYGVGRGSYSPTSNFAGLDATNAGRVGDLWTGFYRSIRNANIVIANGARAVANGVPQATADQLVAEARFMRAFNYFQLVLNWAGVPLRTEKTMEQIDIARSSADEVYALIISDLQAAETALADKAPAAGRPSKWVAKTLLTDVYLNQKRWSDAKGKAQEVISSNQYKLMNVSVPNDFYKIFAPDVITTPEDIFKIVYTSLKPASFTVMLHYPSAPYNGGSGSYAAYSDSVSNKAIKAWDTKDLRKGFNLYNWNIGVGSTTMLYKKFINPNPTSGLDCDYPIYRYADLLLIYAEADCRLNGGPTADGMEKLNMIHRRGYGKAPGTVSTLDFKATDYTEDTFIDLLLNERMYEFFSEYKRFYDLRRTGKLKQRLKEIRGIDVADKHFLWPIPNVEYNYNKEIDPVKDQNPGY